MINPKTEYSLLSLARRYRDQLDFKVKAGIDSTSRTAAELADVQSLIKATEQETKTAPAWFEAYCELEMAARVMMRWARSPDGLAVVPSELRNLDAAVTKYALAAEMMRQVKERGEDGYMGRIYGRDDGADAMSYALEAWRQSHVVLAARVYTEDDCKACKGLGWIRVVRPAAHGVSEASATAPCPVCVK